MAANLLLEAVEGGGYVSWWKAIPLLLLLLLWTRLLTWADKDAIAAHLPREKLNMAMLGGLIVGYALFFLVPINFFVAFLIPLVCFAAECGIYCMVRKKQVGLGDLRSQFDAWLRGFRKQKEVADPIWQVQLQGKSGVAPPPAKDSPERPAFEAVQLALTDPLRKNCEQLDLAPSEVGLVVKYTVDGFSYTGATVDGTAGAGAISLIKTIAGMNVDDRRKPQTGSMKVAVDEQRKECKVQTAGTTAGEYLRLIIDPSKRNNLALADMGFTPPQLDAVKESIQEMQGVALIGAPKGHGQTTLQYAMMRAHDAYLQHLQTIEHDAQQDLEGITQTKLPPNATGADELKAVDWAVSQEPDVILIDRIDEPRTALALAEFARNKRPYVGVRAGSAAEAIEWWRKLVGDPSAALDPLKLVVVGRVLRKLCDACKESYAPDPNTLRRLNLNPEKVSTLYKARELSLRDPKGNPIPCTFCHDLRFKGRVGVYEVVVVDDEMRDALRKDFAAGGKVGAGFKTAFRKQRGRYLQEEALALVERGDTSMQEVLRLLKPASDAKPASSARPPATAPARRSSAQPPA